MGRGKGFASAWRGEAKPGAVGGMGESDTRLPTAHNGCEAARLGKPNDERLIYGP